MEQLKDALNQFGMLGCSKMSEDERKLRLSKYLKLFDTPQADEELEEIYNREVGDLTGYNCKICKNRGYIYHVQDGEISLETCKCMTIRANLRRLEASGLAKAARQCTFNNFQVEADWQKNMLSTAKRFLYDKDRRWMFVSGQTGCGKTHICTAMTVQFIKAGAEARYMQWLELSQELQADIFNAEKYEQKISPLKRAKVLYIDDLFKTQGNKLPDPKEFRLAMELLNARYNDPTLITIISTEHPLRRLFQMDEALAGRIAERSKGYVVQIAQQPGRNYRERFIGVGP